MSRDCKGERKQNGFTLVELLVVIGIIALLISILLPALHKAQLAAERTVCLSNQRQMSQAYTMYIAENRGYLPMGWPDSPSSGSKTVVGTHWFYPWFLGNAFGPGNGNTEQAIKKGCLYKYLNSIKVFHCAGDKGLRKVSYGQNCYLNGEDFGGTVYKATNVKHHSKTFITIDEYDDRGGNAQGYNLGSFAILPKPSLVWVDRPGLFHVNSSGISFLDGHADILVWDASQTRHLFTGNNVTANAKDILKLQMVRGEMK